MVLHPNASYDPRPTIVPGWLSARWHDRSAEIRKRASALSRTSRRVRPCEEEEGAASRLVTTRTPPSTLGARAGTGPGHPRATAATPTREPRRWTATSSAGPRHACGPPRAVRPGPPARMDVAGSSSRRCRIAVVSPNGRQPTTRNGRVGSRNGHEVGLDHVICPRICPDLASRRSVCGVPQTCAHTGSTSTAITSAPARASRGSMRQLLHRSLRRARLGEAPASGTSCSARQGRRKF